MKIQASDLPGASALYRDYLQRFERVKDFYEFYYGDEKNVLEQMERIRRRKYPRIELGRILERQNRLFGAGEATFKKIEDLALGNANVIITGQQVSLFGGPLFVLYKILTAIKLADRLSRVCKDCFVPVFWLATDDTDFEEVNHIFFLSRNYRVMRLQLEDTRPAALAMSRVSLPDSVSELTARLASELPDTEFKAEILSALQEAYQPGRNMGEAFGRWLMHLFKDFGLVLVDPSDGELKSLAAEILEREIADQSPATRIVLETSNRLQARGYAPQIHLREGYLNLFYFEPHRHALIQQNGQIHSTDSRIHFDRQQLLQRLRENPDQFAPNVVLRPLMQDSIFPTVAYVAGPAEIAYFAQLREVYSYYNIPMPLIFPRKSMTLIEPTIDRILDKYHLGVKDLWGNVETIINALARQRVPDELFNTLQRFRQQWPEALFALKKEIHAVDPTLEKMVDSTAGRISHAVDQLEKKVVQAAKRQNEIISQQLHKAAAALFPENKLQERVLHFTPFLVKYGPIFIERLYEVMDIVAYNHQLVRL